MPATQRGHRRLRGGFTGSAAASSIRRSNHTVSSPLRRSVDPPSLRATALGPRIRVLPTSRNQVFVGADLLHPTVFEVDDAICSLNSRQAMSDDHHRSTTGQSVNCLGDGDFVLSVEGGSGFVEKNNRSVLEECPRNRDPLTFTAGQQ